MTNQRIAFIGGGHITEIILRRLGEGLATGQAEFIASDRDEERLRHLGELFRIETTTDNVAAARRGDFIFVNLRPEIVPAVLPDLLAAQFTSDQVVISLAAGIPLDCYALLGERQPLVRALPNPPSQIGQGIAALVYNSQVSAAQRQKVRSLFEVLGPVVEVDEPYLDVITSLSSPVATYLFFQALIDAGVRCGLPRAVSTQVASQTIIGSMGMWQARKTSPYDLIGEASTPGGISVEILYALEEHAFKAAIIDAITRGAERARALGQKFGGQVQ